MSGSTRRHRRAEATKKVVSVMERGRLIRDNSGRIRWEMTSQSTLIFRSLIKVDSRCGGEEGEDRRGKKLAKETEDRQVFLRSIFV